MKKQITAKRDLSLAPILRFSPTAWAKLLFLRDLGDTEVGGFATSADDDPLFVEDFHLIRQTCTSVTVRFEDQAVADYFDSRVDDGLKPSNFGRIWIHTHPGSSAEPSWTDERTFARVFGCTDWAVMFIIARNGQTYARLRFSVGPSAALVVPMALDFSRDFASSDFAAWDEEYQACVHPEPELPPAKTRLAQGRFDEAFPERSITDSWPEHWDDWLIDSDQVHNPEDPLYDI
jgi:proteasome lid subunit RPN8/RPN11